MRYLVMHRHDSHTEAGEPAPAALVAEMGAFISEYARTGKFLGGEGLGASKTRTRVTFRDGRATVKHGPYTGEHELPSDVWLLRVETREQAIGWAERYGKIVGDGEVELGAVTEPWDLGMMPRPDDAPLRILMVVKADRISEAGEPRDPRQKAAITRLRTEMTKAGVLTTAESMLPSSQSKRLVFTNNALRTIDGPFSESKELVGGFAILRLDDMAEAIDMCKRYAKILGGTLEIDVRPLADPEPTVE